MHGAKASVSLRGVELIHKVFGWIGLEPYRYFDTEFMKEYETKGVAVTVGESAKVNANIQVISIAQD